MALRVCTFCLLFFGLSVLFAAFLIAADDPADTSTEPVSPFIPKTKEQITRLQKSLTYRELRIKEQQVYLKTLRSKLAEVEKKPKSRMQGRQRSAIALRIVRSGSQMETDKVRVIELRGRLQAAQSKEDLNKVKIDGQPFEKLHARTMASARDTIAKLMTQMGPAITEKNSKRSFEDLKKTLQGEFQN